MEKTETKRDNIKILVTLNENYMMQLKVMLTSLFINNPGEVFEVYLLHRGIGEESLKRLEMFCQKNGAELKTGLVDEKLFEKAPLTREYPQEMYYRLLAPFLLPEEKGRFLYLDPDILVINPIRKLWETDLCGNLFAAAAHTGKTEFANDMNRIRLKVENNYFNSGVLVMDFDAGRQEIVPSTVFDYVKEHEKELVLPDQDVLNGLYGRRILELPDVLYNYDARNFSNYYLRSSGEANVDWVMENTVILHFCGKAKPWKPFYRHRFGILYKHYMQLAKRMDTYQGQRR